MDLSTLKKTSDDDGKNSKESLNTVSVEDLTKKNVESEKIPLVVRPPLARVDTFNLDDYGDDGGVNSTKMINKNFNNSEEVFHDGNNDNMIAPYIPEFFSRLGETDTTDGKNPTVTDSQFPGRDIEIATFTDFESIPDVNVYQHKKTLAQGMMDLALFSANANQLRYVLESYSRHPYFYPSLVMISFSLIFQVAVGVGLIWNATYNVKDKREICIANKINNFTIIGIFLVTVINVFISAFGVAGPPTT